VAERSGLIVLHLDKDFELIAEITGQPVERLLAQWRPAPTYAAMFGSTARGQERPDSDVDLFRLRPGNVAFDDQDWRRQVGELERDLTRLTGNDTRVLEIGVAAAHDPGVEASVLRGGWAPAVRLPTTVLDAARAPDTDHGGQGLSGLARKFVGGLMLVIMHARTASPPRFTAVVRACMITSKVGACTTPAELTGETT
jgi:predicted nucleotidyltransferase